MLPIGGVCLLGSLNLTQFITSNGKWDYDRLAKYIPIAVRMMDNVNDITNVPLKSQKENLLNKRRIGLGIMGYGSALLMMQTRFGSKKALKQLDELMSFIANTAYSASALLAKEKGAFPLYDEKEYLNSNFIKQALNEDTIALIKKHGIRNSHLLSIQPTGNSSVFANNVSGGQEPVFMFDYIRTSMQPHAPEGLDLPKNIDWSNKTYDIDSNLNWEFIKEGDTPLLRILFNGETWKIDEARGLLKESLVEDYGVKYLRERGTWNENAEWASNTFNLSVDDHVNTMKVFSKYIDSAMSKTVNLPEDYSFEDFKNLYIDCWKSGTIKGATTYREGTMTSVLASTDKKEESEGFTQHDAPKRPKELPVDLYRVTAKGKEWLVLVGLFDNKPYEVFAIPNDFELKPKSTKGTLTKHARGRYEFTSEEFNLKDIGQTMSDEEAALTRKQTCASVW